MRKVMSLCEKNRSQKNQTGKKESVKKFGTGNIEKIETETILQLIKREKRKKSERSSTNSGLNSPARSL